MMDLLLNIDIKKLPAPVVYTDKLFLIGSCFTEHIGNALSELKFPVLQNPNGILFGPDSVCKSLQAYIENKKYSENDLFSLHELWHSWQYHSRFSGTGRQEVLERINQSQQQAHAFLKAADWLIITLGSSFSYRLTPQASLASEAPGSGVANCHRAPAAWFEKKMLAITDISAMLDHCIRSLRRFNPALRFIFTISPVRHVRDGVV